MRKHFMGREAGQRSVLLQQQLLGLCTDLAFRIEQVGPPQGNGRRVDLSQADQRPRVQLDNRSIRPVLSLLAKQAGLRGSGQARDPPPRAP